MAILLNETQTCATSARSKHSRSPLMYPATVIAIALLASLPLQASDVPASAEAAERLVHTTLQLEPNAAQGEKLYRERCARCHFETASGDPGNLVPRLAGQRKAYLVKQLVDFMKVQRDGDEMHAVVSQPFADEPQALSDVTTYLSNLRPAGAAEMGNGTTAKLGESLYTQHCATCHGSNANGSEDGFVPSLRAQHYSYLIWQMRSVAASRRLHVHPEVVRSLSNVSQDDMASIADYLSRMDVN